MSQNHRILQYSHKPNPAVIIVVLVFLTTILACSFTSGVNQDLRETDIALGIQQTLVAQTATAIVSSAQTPLATFTAVPVVDTPQVQAATPTTAPSDTPPPPTDAPTIVPPTAPIAPAAAISITDWKPKLFVPVSSGCKIPDAQCWKMDDDWRKISIDNQIVLTSQTPVLIDPSWARPFLVFWHRYKFEDLAAIEISGDGIWSTMKNMNRLNSGNSWRQEAVDLAMFKGKEIIIRLTAQAKIGAGDWFINDIQIVPDYQP